MEKFPLTIKKKQHSFKICPAALRDDCLGSLSCDQASRVIAGIFWCARLPTCQPDPALSPDRERMLPKPTLKHPLNEMALRQQFGGRAEGAYQSLNCCLTALQHKTHLIEKMADKPCEILRPQGERRSTLLRAGAVSEDLSFSCCCCTILLAVVSCISFSLILFFFLNFSIFLCSLFIRRAKNDTQWCQSTITLSASCHEMGEIEWDNRSFLLSHVKRSSKSHNIAMKEVAN